MADSDDLITSVFESMEEASELSDEHENRTNFITKYLMSLFSESLDVPDDFTVIDQTVKLNDGIIEVNRVIKVKKPVEKFNVTFYIDPADESIVGEVIEKDSE